MNAVLSSSLPAMERQNHRGIWYGNTRSWSRKKVGVVQFIKGTWPNGERNLLEPHGVEFQVMATGFTWIHKTASLIPPPAAKSGNMQSGCLLIPHWIWFCLMN